MWWLVLLAQARAETPTMTLDQALAAALTSPAAVQAGLTRDEAAAGVVQANAAYDPILTASAGVSRSTTSSAASTAGDLALGLHQALPTGTTISATTSMNRDSATASALTAATAALDGSVAGDSASTWAGAADLSLTQDLLAPLRQTTSAITSRTASERADQAETVRRQQINAAVGATAEAWWTWWGATDAETVARSALASAASLEDRTRAWRDAGDAAQLELDRVTAERLGAEADLLGAEADVDRAREALLALIGHPIGRDSDDGLVPAGSGRGWPATDLDDVDLVVDDALARNLDLALDRQLRDAAGAAERDARAVRLPSLEVTAAIGVGSLSERAADAVSQLASRDAQPRASAAVDLTAPLGRRASRGAVDAARAGTARATSALDADSLRVQAEARAAVTDVQTANRRLALAQARVDVARATEAGEQARVDEGIRRLDQLLDATASRLGAEADVRTAQIALARAELALASLRDRVVDPAMTTDTRAAGGDDGR